MGCVQVMNIRQQICNLAEIFKDGTIWKHDGSIEKEGRKTIGQNTLMEKERREDFDK